MRGRWGVVLNVEATNGKALFKWSETRRDKGHKADRLSCPSTRGGRIQSTQGSSDVLLPRYLQAKSKLWLFPSMKISLGRDSEKSCVKTFYLVRRDPSALSTVSDIENRGA